MYYGKIIYPSIKQMVLKLFKGIPKPKLLLKLNYLFKQMKQINQHYLQYPQDLSGYETWREIENDIFNKVLSKLNPKSH
jgi:hypothetical protein